MHGLGQRDEYLIASHHRRETLISQFDPDPAHRHQTLARRRTGHGNDPALVTSPPDARVGR